jgi:DNA-binding MarR family transcriptional regulator
MYVQPGYLIRRLHQRSTAEFAAVTTGSDITQIQLSILLVVAEFPGTDAARISDFIGSDRTTIGQALLRLEKRNLIRRETGTRDKRTKRLVITARGRSLTASLSPLVPSIGSRILEGLTSRERNTLLRILTKLVARSEGGKAVGSKE